MLPQPPFGLEEVIAEYGVASMDISDGLFSDLAHLCRASEVSATIDQQAIPLSAAARNAIAAEPSLLEIALKGGDDYQCLMAISNAKTDAFEGRCADKGLTVSKIGVLTKQTDPLFRLTNGGEHLESKLDGFTHF